MSLNQHANNSIVSMFDVFEVVLESTVYYKNPFVDVRISAEFTSPLGRKLKACGFYDGGNIWRLRIAPDEEGIWNYAIISDDTSNEGLHNRTGSFTCVPSSSKGFIRVDPVRKYNFLYSDGTPFYGMGDTCYGMVNGINDSQRIEYLNTRAAQKINFIRFFASGFPRIHHADLEEKHFFAWGGTFENPDFDRFNPEYFQRLEGILAELKERGIYAEIEIFNLYLIENQHGNFKEWFFPAERRERWLRYIVSRFSAYTTVFLWTIANEYALYPDGIYRYDGESDDDWVRSMGALVHHYDPHKHPTTVHPVFITNLGPVFGSGDEIDVITHQQNSYDSARWISEPLPGYQEGPGTEAGEDILADRKYNKPVINTESGYEWLLGYPSDDSHQVHSTDKCRRTAWRIFVSGGAAYAAGFSGTVYGRDNFYRHNRITRNTDGPMKFQVADMGLGAQLAYHYEFVTKETGFINMDPAMQLVNTPNLCLANPGHEYVIYAPEGGSVRLDLSDSSDMFTVKWLNPRNGEYYMKPEVSGGESHTFILPDNEDWVIHLKLKSDRNEY